MFFVPKTFHPIKSRFLSQQHSFFLPESGFSMNDRINAKFKTIRRKNWDKKIVFYPKNFFKPCLLSQKLFFLIKSCFLSQNILFFSLEGDVSMSALIKVEFKAIRLKKLDKRYLEVTI